MTDLNLRHVRYFVAVAEELHFGRAAARLYVAQPSLSAQIRSLEESLGVPLLVRSTRRVTLTPTGERFLGVARRLLATADSAVDAARQAEPLRLATIVDGLDTVPLVLRQLRLTEPDLPVAHAIAGMPRQVVDVLADRLDIALGQVRPLPPELEGEIVRHDPVGVVLRADHPLALRPAVLIRDLAGVPRVYGSRLRVRIVGKKAGYKSLTRFSHRTKKGR